MDFDYERDTKNHYKSVQVAMKYHESFNRAKMMKNLRYRLIANREKKIVYKFLSMIPHKTVLDIPAGTGKLAPVFKKLKAKVLSGDVSEAMLAIAKTTYEKLGYYENVDFVICDAEKIFQTVHNRFESAVCLRLLHRVPPKVKTTILKQLAMIAPYSIISFGLDTFWHRFRRSLIRMLFNGEILKTPLVEKISDIVYKINEHFEVINFKYVLPILSKEVVFLLRSLRYKR